MKICYVTGATGCVGRNLIDELIIDNWDIVVLHRKSSDLSRLKECKVRFQEVDLFDLDCVCQSIAPKADAIFHVAGNTSHWDKEADQQWKDNVLTTRNLVQSALKNKTKRFIFTSTGATNPHQWTDERMTLKIKEGYIRTKRLAELEVFKGIENGLDAVIVKPIIVIGAYDINSYSQIFTMLKSNPIKIIFPGKIAFCHARSVAQAHIQAFKKGRTAESYVLGGTFTTWLDLAQRICKLLKVDLPQKSTSFPVLMAFSFGMLLTSMITNKKPALTPHLIRLLHDAADVTYYEKQKTHIELGYESSSLDVMIKDCYDWMVKEKRI